MCIVEHLQGMPQHDSAGSVFPTFHHTSLAEFALHCRPRASSLEMGLIPPSDHIHSVASTPHVTLDQLNGGTPGSVCLEKAVRLLAGDRDHGAMGSALTAEHDAAGGGAETRLDFENKAARTERGNKRKQTLHLIFCGLSI